MGAPHASQIWSVGSGGGAGTFAICITGGQARDGELPTSREFIHSIFSEAFEVSGKEINLRKSVPFFVVLLIVLFFIWLGARLGSIGIGFAGGFGGTWSR